MTDFFVGEIKMVGFNFAQSNFALCNGALLSINDNQTLYVLIGTTYGGDGVNTFGLPDFRGRVAVGQGSGPGLTTRTVGDQFGAEQVTLTTAQMPSHNHALVTNNVKGTDDVPTATSMPSQAVQAGGGQSALLYTTSGTVPIQPKAMLPQAIGVTGGNLPHPNLAPALTVNFQIALFGIFPTRN